MASKGEFKQSPPLALHIPASTLGFHQPHFVGQLGNKILRIFPDTGATTSWVCQQNYPDFETDPQHKSSLPLINQKFYSHQKCDFGFDKQRDRSENFTILEEKAPDIQHDGGPIGSASWMTERFCFLSLENSETVDSELVFQLKILEEVKQTRLLDYDCKNIGTMFTLLSYPTLFTFIFSKYFFEGLLGLGVRPNHEIGNNFLLRLAESGFFPQVTFNIGQPYQANPHLLFGAPLSTNLPYYHPHYFSLHAPPKDSDPSGSHWYLRISKIVWKCKDEPHESVYSQENSTWNSEWKRNDPEKKFEKRSWSWGWVDTGYATMVFPGTLGGGDCLELQKLKKDLLAGDLGVLHGTWAKPIQKDKVRIEYIGFVFNDHLENLQNNNPTNIQNNNTNIPQNNNTNIPQNNNTNIPQNNNTNIPQNNSTNIPQNNNTNLRQSNIENNNANIRQNNNQDNKINNMRQNSEIKFLFTLEDMMDENGERKFELEIENKNLDRKCCILGLPFTKKFCTEFQFNPSHYSSKLRDIGQDCIGFLVKE